MLSDHFLCGLMTTCHPFPWWVCSGRETGESLVPSPDSLTCFLAERDEGFAQTPSPEGPISSPGSGPASKHSHTRAASRRIPVHGESWGLGPLPLRPDLRSGSLARSCTSCDLSEP